MGFALASAFAGQGALVTLVAGPVSLATPERVHRRIDVSTAVEMNEAVQSCWADMDLGVACAAVSDFRPAQTSNTKWHRADMPEAIAMEENPDILHGMGQSKTAVQRLVGFALETDDGMDSAKAKLTRKNLDAVVLNTLQDDGAGFAVDTNKVTVLQRNGQTVGFDLQAKDELAQKLVDLWRTTLIS